MEGIFAGKEAKGSDMLWRAFMRAFRRNADEFSPARLATVSPDAFGHRMLADDCGPLPFPDFEERFRATRAYGRYCIEAGMEPKELVERANSAEEPLGEFLKLTTGIPGYDRDPLRKKNLLLAMVMAHRPERFLRVSDPEHWAPIVDYHLMRVALRTGMVRVLDPAAAENNRNRQWADAAVEREIRSATAEAIRILIERSAKPMSVVDHVLWSARRYCPEMREPDCARCLLNEACEKRTELFQPVFRTTAY
jgi:hypothetical protein